MMTTTVKSIRIMTEAEEEEADLMLMNDRACNKCYVPVIVSCCDNQSGHNFGYKFGQVAGDLITWTSSSIRFILKILKL